MRIIRSLIVPTLAVAATFAAGEAESAGFSQVDRNRDGVVTFDEAQRVFFRLTEIHFGKCDPNGDGVIEKNEFPVLNNFYTMMYVRRD